MKKYPFLQQLYKYRYTIMTIVFSGLLWEVLSQYEILNPHFIPPPSYIAKAWFDWLSRGELVADLFASMGRGTVGLVLGAAVGIMLGLLTGRITLLDQILSPIMNVLRSFPPVSLLPVFITLLGIGDVSKVFSIAFAVIFPVWINTHIGATKVAIEFLRSASLMTQSSWRIFTKIVIPASLSWIIGGIRLGISMAFIMIYVSELAGASAGLGYRIAASHLAYRYDLMFSALFTLGILSAVIDMVFRYSTHYFFPFLTFNTEK